MTETAAALLKDGKLVAAAEEERFTRVKHQGGFPFNAIRFCLKQEGIRIQDIDHVALYWKPHQVLYRSLIMLRGAFLDPRMFMSKLQRAKQVVLDGREGDQFGSWMDMFKVEGLLRSLEGGENARFKLHRVEHHCAHIASCFFCSPFREAAILTLDGAGESKTVVLAQGVDNCIKELRAYRLPHSLGHFYTSITGFLGFQVHDGEYKVMGLSPYGEPEYAEYLTQKVLRSDRKGSFSYDWTFNEYHSILQGKYEDRACKLFGPPRRGEDEELTDRHRNVAASAQRAFEKVAVDLSVYLYEVTKGLTNICVAGGCGLNCAFNGKLLSEGPYERIYVPPAPHDAGAALGAALWVYHRYLKRPREFVLDQAAWGAEFSTDYCRRVLDGSGLKCKVLLDSELVDVAARLLAEGKIGAWFDGRMEFGPRALGSRSFIADPRFSEITEIMNIKIKKREPFRPFAPSVVEERSAEFFDLKQPSPFMTVVCPVLPAKRKSLQAVAHIDGSARPQTVNRRLLPKYHALLTRFGELTGIPVVLNTSFNIQEPIVCTPEEAVATFLRSGVDFLCMQNCFVTRE